MMGLSVSQTQLIYLISNFLIALVMLCAAFAVIFAIVSKRLTHMGLSLLVAGVFIFFGVRRLFNMINLPTSLTTVEVAIDGIGALLALAASFLFSVIAIRALHLPTHNELVKQKLNAIKAHHQFEAFMENLPALGFMKDENGELCYVNKMMEREFGLAKDELLSRSQTYWNDVCDVEAIKADDRYVIENARKLESTVHYRLADGCVHEYLIIRFPIAMDSHIFVGGIGIDVTESRKTAELNARLAAIVESSEDAIIGLSLDGRVITWNQGASRLYGYSAEEAIGRDFRFFCSEELNPGLNAMFANVLEQNSWTRRPFTITCKDGKRLDVWVSGFPIKNERGEVIGVAGIGKDISDRVAQERKIQELNDELKARVYELAEANASIQSARDHALEASNLKSAFVANISHELRTPLSGILGMSELVLARDNLDEETTSMMRTILDSANALLQVVNDILDLSKIEAGKVSLEYEPFNAAFLVADCTKVLAPAAKNKGLDLRLTIDQHLPQFIYGDASRVRQVLLNLIGNAVKFTEKGYVSVEARVTEETDSRVVVVFEVADTGIGIGEDERRYLFRPFVQVDHTFTRRFGGTGLGLSISKHFVEMMGGKIGVRSRKDTGSTFWFEVPFEKKNVGPEVVPKQTRAVMEPLPADVALRRKVLVVEDNAALRVLALRQMSILGIQAESVEFGNQAIEMYNTGSFDIILMDINLPDISGYEATSQIRELEKKKGIGAPIPIIAMTAGAMRGDREKALNAGMDDYLAKPVHIDQLRGMLNKWLRRLPEKNLSQKKSPDT